MTRFRVVLACALIMAAAVPRACSGHHADHVGRVTARPAATTPDSYDQKVLSLRPVLYLPLDDPWSAVAADDSGHGHDGTFLPPGSRLAVARLPNGDPAPDFDGDRQYVQVASALELSVPATGYLTVQAWIRPDVLQFRSEEGTGYVYPLGKGTAGKREYALRMYSRHNTETPVRPNRISAYVWNLRGGEGSGAYFQDLVMAGSWIMVTFVIDAVPSQDWPHGYVAIYKDSRLRGQVSLAQFGVVPQAADAPLRIATRDLRSFFAGAVAKVAIYGYVVPADQIAATYAAMFP